MLTRIKNIRGSLKRKTHRHSSNTQPRPSSSAISLQTLPTELLLSVVTVHLSPHDIFRLSKTCRRLFYVLRDDTVWLEFLAEYWPELTTVRQDTMKRYFAACEFESVWEKSLPPSLYRSHVPLSQMTHQTHSNPVIRAWIRPSEKFTKYYETLQKDIQKSIHKREKELARHHQLIQSVEDTCSSQFSTPNCANGIKMVASTAFIADSITHNWQDHPCYKACLQQILTMLKTYPCSISANFYMAELKYICSSAFSASINGIGMSSMTSTQSSLHTIFPFYSEKLVFHYDWEPQHYYRHVMSLASMEGSDGVCEQEMWCAEVAARRLMVWCGEYARFDRQLECFACLIRIRRKLYLVRQCSQHHLSRVSTSGRGRTRRNAGEEISNFRVTQTSVGSNGNSMTVMMTTSRSQKVEKKSSLSKKKHKDYNVTGFGTGDGFLNLEGGAGPLAPIPWTSPPHNDLSEIGDIHVGGVNGDDNANAKFLELCERAIWQVLDGDERFLNGDQEKALKVWKKALHMLRSEVTAENKNSGPVGQKENTKHHDIPPTATVPLPMDNIKHTSDDYHVLSPSCEFGIGQLLEAKICAAIAEMQGPIFKWCLMV